MAVVQSTYGERMAAAVAGMVANMRTFDSITRSVDGADGIGFGLAVGRSDTDGARMAKIAGAIDEFLGASMRDPTLLTSVATDEYQNKQNMGILTQGEIWVQVTGTPGPDDPVHYNATTGVFAASGGTGPVLGARWMEISASGLGRVFLPGYGQAT